MFFECFPREIETVMTAFDSRTQEKTQRAADNLTRVKERHGGVTQALVRRESLERRFVLSCDRVVEVLGRFVGCVSNSPLV